MRGSGTFWRLLNEARLAERVERGLPLRRDAMPAVSRRHLIASMAAVAGTQLLPRPASAATPHAKITIVGGGIAGLVALDTLVAAGFDATLFEARQATGGRIRTTVGMLGDGLAVDDGGQLVNTNHDDVRALCKRFNLPLIDRESTPSRGIILGPRGSVPQHEIVTALRPLAKRIEVDAKRVEADMRAMTMFDAMPVSAYLDRIGAQGTVRRLLESTIRTEYGVEPAQASSLELLWNLPTVDGDAFETSRVAVSG
jgi:monoamine oxidase